METKESKTLKKRKPRLVLKPKTSSNEKPKKEWADWLEHVPTAFL